MKEMLITSSVLILVLLLLRLIFAKKVSRRLIYGAWMLVALRLLIPMQIGQMDFSVLTATREVTQAIEQVSTRPVSGPSQQEVYKDIIVDYVEKNPTAFAPQVQEQIREETANGTATKEEIADIIQQKYPEQEIFVPQVQQQVQQRLAEQTDYVSIGQLATAIWLAGVAAMAVWFAVVNLRYGWLVRKTSKKLDVDSPIAVYVSESVTSPCLVGHLRPVIYLTPTCADDGDSRRHVLTHELTHYRHGDDIWSLVRCVCLCVYWFNPLVWVAAWVSRRDCELACDEGALKRLGEAERIAYGETLLEVVSHNAMPSNLLQTATAMAESKKQLKERVSFIAKKPKISLIAVVSMVLICAIVVGCTASGSTELSGSENADHTQVPTTEPTEPEEPEVKQTVYLPASYKLTTERETIDRTYTYNELGQCIQYYEEWISEEWGHVKTQLTYQYDDHGNLTQEIWHQTRDQNGNVRESSGEWIHLYTYDDKDRVTEYSCNNDSYVYSFQYDDQNNRITVTHQDDNWWLYYQYDENGRMTQELSCNLQAEGYQPDWKYRYVLRTFDYTKEGKIQIYAGKAGYANEKLDLSGLDRVENWKDLYDTEFYYDARGNLTGAGKPNQYQYDENNLLVLKDETEIVTVRGEMVERILAKYTRDQYGNVIRFEDYLRVEEVTYVALELTTSQAKAARERMTVNGYGYNIFDVMENVIVNVYPFPWYRSKLALLIPGAPW